MAAAKTKHTGRAFALDSWVKWTSQSAGSAKEKVGRVVLRVPPHYRPYPADTMRDVQPWGKARDHESYVVEVQVGKDGRVHRYWPLVSALKPCDPVVGVGVRRLTGREYAQVRDRARRVLDGGQ